MTGYSTSEFRAVVEEAIDQGAREGLSADEMAAELDALAKDVRSGTWADTGQVAGAD